MKSLKINALAAIMVKILNILFPLITGPYIFRILSKENIALFDSANTITQFFIPFATLGIYTYGVRTISKIKDNKELVNKLFSELFYLSIFSTILTFIIYIVYTIFISKINNNIIIYVYIILGFQILSQFIYIEWLNEAFENYTFILYKTIFVRILTFILVFVFINDANDIIPYTIIITLSEVLNSFISFLWIKKDVKLVKFNFKNISKLLSSLIVIFFMANINMLYIYLDRIFLTNVPHKTYISDYVLAFNIVMIIMGVIGGVIGVNTPRLSYYLGTNNIEEYNNLIKKGSQFFFLLISPISFGLIILGNEAAIIYGGDKFLSAGIVTSFFAIRALIWALDSIIGIQVLFVQGYEKYMAFFITIGGVINLLLNYYIYTKEIFLPQYYILTTIIAEFFVIIIYILFIIKKNIINLKIILKYTIRYTFISSTFFIVSFFINYIYPHNIVVNTVLFINIFIKIICCVFIYTIILALIKDSAFIYIISFLKAKIKKKFPN